MTKRIQLHFIQITKEMFSNHMNDEVANIRFNLNKFVQNKANIECNYCHKKCHFANGQAQDLACGIHKHLVQANVVQETSLNNVQFCMFHFNQTLVSRIHDNQFKSKLSYDIEKCMV
jgi:hypothetical protein